MKLLRTPGFLIATVSGSAGLPHQGGRACLERAGLLKPAFMDL